MSEIQERKVEKKERKEKEKGKRKRKKMRKRKFSEFLPQISGISTVETRWTKK